MIRPYLTADRHRGTTTKYYTEAGRYECELTYNRYFAEAGFAVPRILQSDPVGLTIVFEWIEGRSRSRLRLAELAACQAQLERIAQLPVIGDTAVIAQQYAGVFHESYQAYLCAHRLAPEAGRLAQITSLLTHTFRAGWFKDAKPSNWRFTPNGRLILLDFDCVRPSFALADLAKLLAEQTDISYSRKLAACQTFAGRLAPAGSPWAPPELEILYNLATALAALSVLYGPRPLSPARRRRLELQARQSLLRLGLRG